MSGAQHLNIMIHKESCMFWSLNFLILVKKKEKLTLLFNKWNSNNKPKVQLPQLQFTFSACVEVSFWVEGQGCAGKMSNFQLGQCKKTKTKNQKPKQTKKLIKGIISFTFSYRYLLPGMGKLWLKSVNASENMMACNRTCKPLLKTTSLNRSREGRMV